MEEGRSFLKLKNASNWFPAARKWFNQDTFLLIVLWVWFWVGGGRNTAARKPRFLLRLGKCIRQEGLGIKYYFPGLLCISGTEILLASMGKGGHQEHYE